MGDRELMRASDDDRQQVVDRLRAAVEDGRLKMEEFTERMGLAYQAVTYGDLGKSVADLPRASPQPESRLAPALAANRLAQDHPNSSPGLLVLAGLAERHRWLTDGQPT